MPSTSKSLFEREIDRRSLLKIASLCAFAAAALPSVSFATEGVSSETSAALSSTQAAYQQALSDLSALTAQAEQAQYELDAANAALEETNEKLSELEQSIQEKTIELNEKQDALADTISSNYKVGKTSFLESLLGSTSFEDFVNRITFQNKISDDDAAQIQEVLDLKNSLESEQTEYQQQKEQQEQEVSEAQSKQQSLDEQTSAMQSYTNSLSSEVVALLQQAQNEQAEYQRQLAAAQTYSTATTGSTSSNGSSGTTSSGTSGTSGGSSGESSTTSNSGGESSNTATTSGSESTGSSETPSNSDTPSVVEPDPTPSNGGSESGGSYSGGSSGTGTHVSSVISVAEGCLGIPYVWGGTSTSGFDCSGLAQYCYAVCGYSIARDTYSQISEIQSLGNWVSSVDQLQPGDLFFPSSGHVCIYVGGGTVIHAPYPGEVVKYESAYAFGSVLGGGSPV